MCTGLLFNMVEDEFATEVHRDLSEAAPPSPHFDQHLSAEPVHLLQALDLPIKNHRLHQIRNVAINAAPCAGREC
jgi:hypothetical protein